MQEGSRHELEIFKVLRGLFSNKTLRMPEPWAPLSLLKTLTDAVKSDTSDLWACCKAAQHPSWKTFQMQLSRLRTEIWMSLRCPWKLKQWQNWGPLGRLHNSFGCGKERTQQWDFSGGRTDIATSRPRSKPCCNTWRTMWCSWWARGILD